LQWLGTFLGEQMNNWFESIRELCALVVHESTIRDILETAIEENMLTREEAKEIYNECGL
jgi:mannitol/fructose-specific phosphotransferase system IIA component (Ntr-type)